MTSPRRLSAWAARAPPGLLDLVLVQTAVHDAVQAIEGTFEPDHFTGAPGARARRRRLLPQLPTACLPNSIRRNALGRLVWIRNTPIPWRRTHSTEIPGWTSAKPLPTPSSLNTDR